MDSYSINKGLHFSIYEYIDNIDMSVPLLPGISNPGDSDFVIVKFE